MSNDAVFKGFQTTNGAWTLAELQAWDTANNAQMLIKYYGYCDNGYICLEGATSKTPTSISIDRGYPCPVGFYCPSGATIEIPCAPGTYNA